MRNFLLENKNKLIFIVLAFILLIFGSYLFFTNYEIGRASGVDSSQNELKKDLGEISMSDGIKKITFKYKNQSNEPISINNLYTTCMCTKAKLEIGKEESVFAGMKGHKSGLKPINPQMTIGPRKTAVIYAEFDPNAHGPEATGPITRSIVLETDNLNTPKIILTFTGEVAP